MNTIQLNLVENIHPGFAARTCLRLLTTVWWLRLFRLACSSLMFWHSTARFTPSFVPPWNIGAASGSSDIPALWIVSNENLLRRACGCRRVIIT